MKSRELRRILLVVFAILLIAVPAAFAGDQTADRGRQREATAFEIESLFQRLLDSSDVTPTYTDYGDGFHALSIELSPEQREKLMAALGAGDDKAATTFYFLAAGLSQATPADPRICIHAALSTTNVSYNYWVVVLNLGSKDVTRSVGFKLTGPGHTFNKSASFTFGANGIWVAWYNPGFGVNTAGFYTYVGSVTGSGNFTTRTFTVTP